MSSKPKGFQSLADAAGALRDLAKHLSQSRDQKPKTTISTTNPSSKPHRELECQMIEMDRARRAAAGLKSSAKRVKAKVKGKAAKIILRGPGVREAYKEHLAKEQAAQPVRSAPALPQPGETRRRNFERVTQLVGRSTPQIERRPVFVSDDTATMIALYIERGATEFAAAPEPDLGNGFIVGFDFGTSSLKLAVRQPYTAGEPVVVRPVDEALRSGSHPYLWQTALWFDPAEQAFSLVPADGLVSLEGFKTGIIGGTGGQRVREDQPVNRNEAAVAFITIQLAHFFGWYHEDRPLRAGSDRFLSINIGIPVAAQDDRLGFANFRRIISAASELIPHASRLTLGKVRETLNSTSDQLPAGWQVIPELTAAIAGYAASTAARDGSHMLVDVGASTLDLVAFNLVGRDSIAVISAAVELLGSASLDIARSHSVADSVFRSACDEQFDRVYYRQACQFQRGGNGFSPTRRQQPVQLVTTGGGCATDVHDAFIQTMAGEAVLGETPILKPAPKFSESLGGCDQSRLLLAYGLTRDVPELLDLKLPSQVPDISQPPTKSDPFIGPEMT